MADSSDSPAAESGIADNGSVSTPLVEVNALWVRFGPVDAVRGIDLSVSAGTATALLGRNGAGKSTTMRVLAGVIPPTGGVVTVDGMDIRRDTLGVKRAIGYCPDVGGLVPRATPWEHLQLAARLRRLDHGWEERAREMLERFDLGSATHRVTAATPESQPSRLCQPRRHLGSSSSPTPGLGTITSLRASLRPCRDCVRLTSRASR